MIQIWGMWVAHFAVNAIRSPLGDQLGALFVFALFVRAWAEEPLAFITHNSSVVEGGDAHPGDLRGIARPARTAVRTGRRQLGCLAAHWLDQEEIRGHGVGDRPVGDW
jgi:hypothetical protein